MKKLMLLLVIMGVILTGCGQKNKPEEHTKEEEKQPVSEVDKSPESDKGSEKEPEDEKLVEDKSGEFDISAPEEPEQAVDLSHYAEYGYIHSEGTPCFITFHKSSGNEISFDLLIAKYARPDQEGEVTVTAENCTGVLKDGKVVFEYVDSNGKNGSGTMNFDGDDILLKTTVEEAEEELSSKADARLYRDAYNGTQDSSYICEGSDNRYLSDGELKELTARELRLARNEIYARHGYIFSSPEYISYFQKKTWYSYFDAKAFNDNPSEYLNDYEKANIELIKQMEK